MLLLPFNLAQFVNSIPVKYSSLWGTRVASQRGVALSWWFVEIEVVKDSHFYVGSSYKFILPRP